ncbi:hypothetical protein F5878DRAFT_647227 [Lentinula raphanica]|uniref:Uncharacterized protein n=1 Tax=Lentinula raphanica TaxID=153919 RepID=A0AA38U3Y3_9AGAR|nr:hypothetical protein F5878DRAFT_647227 [Lentinula raphanica]
MYLFKVRACSWVYEHSPWGRASERKRRERAIELERQERAVELERREKEIDRELKEASNTRQARALALDFEIGVCKCLLEMLQRSVASTEHRALELEREKELLSQEAIREEREALAKKQKLVKVVIRRVPKAGAQ